MPFGLTNAPATFHALMNEILGDLVNECLVCYLDDILVYSPEAESNIQNTQTVLKRLKKWNMYLKIEKCFFQVTSVQFLGFEVSTKDFPWTLQRLKRF